MRFTASAFLGLALLLCGNTAWAQQTPAPPADQDPKAEDAKKEGRQYFFFEEVLQRSCDDPTLQSAIALPQPKLIVETADGKTKLKARVGMEMRKKYVLSLDVASPTNKSGETTLASLDGLSDGSTAELALSWFLPSDELVTDASKLLELREGELSAGANSAASAGWSMEDYADKSIISRPSAVAALGSPERYKKVIADYRTWMGKKPWIPVFTLRGRAEQKGFDFFAPSAGPPAGLKKTSESHTNYQIIGSAGGYFRGTFYAALTYDGGTGFKPGAKQDFCPPSNLTGVLECETRVVAPPRKTRTETLEFEARELVGSVGVGVHLTRDLQAKVTMIELPVYLLQKLGTSEMELNVGAKAQWRSDTRHYALSVFIGPAFSTVFRGPGAKNKK